MLQACAAISIAPGDFGALVQDTELKEIFYSFAAFGNRRVSREDGPVEMDGARFAKLCKDCKLLDKKLTATDVDLAFSKVKAKGARKIGFAEFTQALDIVAQKKGCEVSDLATKLKGTNGPVTNATQAEPNKFHDDKSLYTGVYKNGGPTNVDNPKDLSGICDRTTADVRGVKKSISDVKSPDAA